MGGPLHPQKGGLRCDRPPPPSLPHPPPPPQEGANINKSLTTLGKVISALAEAVSLGGPGGASHHPLLGRLGPLTLGEGHT